MDSLFVTMTAGAHDVGGDDCFVVLATGDLAEIEQISDDRHQESVLLLLHHASTDRANGPTQRVQCPPAPLYAVELQGCMGKVNNHLYTMLSPLPGTEPQVGQCSRPGPLSNTWYSTHQPAWLVPHMRELSSVVLPTAERRCSHFSSWNATHALQARDPS